MINFNEKLSDVEPKTKLPAGTFTKSANEIVSILKKYARDKNHAIKMINFYINRAGSKLSNSEEVMKAKDILETSNFSEVINRLDNILNFASGTKYIVYKDNFKAPVSYLNSKDTPRQTINRDEARLFDDPKDALNTGSILLGVPISSLKVEILEVNNMEFGESLNNIKPNKWYVITDDTSPFVGIEKGSFLLNTFRNKKLPGNDKIVLSKDGYESEDAAVEAIRKSGYHLNESEKSNFSGVINRLDNIVASQSSEFSESYDYKLELYKVVNAKDLTDVSASLVRLIKELHDKKII